MKTKLARSLVLSGILLSIWGASAHAQGESSRCVLGNDFETGTVENWSSTNVLNFNARNPGSGSSFCLYGKDDSGGSTIDAPTSYQGSWIQKLRDHGCSCAELCYDVNLLVNTGQPSPLSSTFVLYGQNGTYAQFVSNQTLTAGSGWHHFCAPVRLTGGAPPAGTDGTWILHGTNPSWDDIVQHVSGLKFPVDWANGDQVEEVEYDNICLRCKDKKPDFTWTPICAGQPVSFTSTATDAASWDWSTGGQSFSSLPNPTHLFSQPGTYPVTLCVPSSCGGAPLCVTHNVTVAGPAPFSITGPLYASSGSAVYCATPGQSSPPVTYNWSVPSPATATPQTGNPSCATVSWNGLNGGTVLATATTAGPPHCTQHSELVVRPVADPERDCCSGTTLAVTGATLTPIGSNGAYKLQANVSASPGLFSQVIAEILSTIATYPAGTTCAQSGPVESHVTGALALGPLAAVLPVGGSHEVWWQGPPTALSAAAATVNLQLPPFGGACPIDRLKVCMKYSFTSMCCRTCQVIECYDVVPPPCPNCN